MATFEPQKARDLLASNGSTKEDLNIVYGEIQGTIAANFVYRSLVNTNYTNIPVRGGTVRVKRMKSSSSQAYGTARAANEADALANNGVDVKINTDREIAEELDAKDKELFFTQGGLAFLQGRQVDYAITMGEELEQAYFVALQNAATLNGLVSLSSYSTTPTKLSALIRSVESIRNSNVKNVNRSDMVATLAPQWFDDLEDYIDTLPNPRNGGKEAKFFHGVEVMPAVRQGFDAIVQVRGSVAQPVVMGDFEIQKIQLSADVAAYMSYFYGTKAIMPDTVLAGAFDSGISA